MNIKVNGKEHQLDKPININQLLEKLDINQGLFVVEHNMNIINKDDYDKVIVNDQDNVEIVGFAGGG